MYLYVGRYILCNNNNVLIKDVRCHIEELMKKKKNKKMVSKIFLRKKIKN